MMDSLPPNDPNNRPAAKEQPYDGRQPQGIRQRDGVVDMIGDLRDSPIVVAMFLIGLAEWFLRSRCTC